MQTTLMAIPFALSIVGLICAVVALLYGIRQKQLNDELHLINRELARALNLVMQKQCLQRRDKK